MNDEAEIRFPLMCCSCGEITECAAMLHELRRTLNDQGYEVVKRCPDHDLACLDAYCAAREAS